MLGGQSSENRFAGSRVRRDAPTRSAPVSLQRIGDRGSERAIHSREGGELLLGGRLGGDQLLVDDNATARSAPRTTRFAIADLLETGGRERERITVAWGPTQLAH